MMQSSDRKWVCLQYCNRAIGHLLKSFATVESKISLVEKWAWHAALITQDEHCSL